MSTGLTDQGSKPEIPMVDGMPSPVWIARQALDDVVDNVHGYVMLGLGYTLVMVGWVVLLYVLMLVGALAGVMLGGGAVVVVGLLVGAVNYGSVAPEAIALIFLTACFGNKVEAEALPSPLPLAGVQVHLSIDDMPFMTERSTPVRMSPAETLTLNQRILDVLAQRNVSASVFVVCSRLRPGDGTLEAWEAAGHTVGNHTHGHLPLAKVGPEAWLADVAQCHEILSSRLTTTPTWLRYPYLGYGEGQDDRDAATAGLADLGYKTSPITVATSEWMYAYAYRRALVAGDDARRAAIATDFHTHMDAALGEGIGAAAEVPGQAVPQTVLVHLNELVADEIGPLIDRWKGQGVAFIDHDTAMAHPVFARENRYTGRAGLSWLFRIRGDGDPKRAYWFGQEEGRVVETWGPMPVDGVE